jgi:hypothetical protein
LSDSILVATTTIVSARRTTIVSARRTTIVSARRTTIVSARRTTIVSARRTTIVSARRTTIVSACGLCGCSCCCWSGRCSCRTAVIFAGRATQQAAEPWRVATHHALLHSVYGSHTNGRSIAADTLQTGRNARSAQCAGKRLGMGRNSHKRKTQDAKHFPHPSLVLFGFSLFLSIGLEGCRLFSYTKLAKDGVEKVFGGGFANHFADGVDGDAKIQGDEL